MRVQLMGYEVAACNDPQDALNLFDQEDFALILTDQKMGEITGTELMRELRKKDPHLPVIIMTAFGTVDDAVDSIKQGAFNYIEKPVDAAELEAQIQMALDRRALEQRIALERDLWSRAIESLGAGLLLLDAEGQVIWKNRIPEELMLPDPKGTGAHCSEILNQKVLPCESCPREKAMETGKGQSIEHRNPLTNNWFLITFTPLKDPGGKFSQTAVLFLDITEIKRAEQSRMEQERLQGMLEMAGAVAHELSQPLQAILGWSEIMLSQEVPEPYSRYLESICNQVDILKELIGRINNITRYAKKEYPGSLTIVDLQKASATEAP